jgi:type VI secretion system secreted protein VgrG
MHAAVLDLPGFPARTLDLLRLSGRIALGRPYAFDLVLAAPGRAGALEERMGQPARLLIGGTAVHGIVAEGRLVQGGPGQGTPGAGRLRLVPRLGRLDLVRRSRVFLERTLPELLKEVLEEHGLASPLDWQLRLDRPWPTREGICQHEETDLAFLCRWCEREGVTFRFVQDGGRDQVIFLEGQDFPSMDLDPARLGPLRARAAAVPARVRAEGALPDRPWRTVAREEAVAAAGFGCQERDLVPASQAEAGRLASLGAQARAWPAQALEGVCTLAGLAPGQYAGPGGPLILETRLAWRPGADPVVRFLALPAQVPYAPPRDTPWPRLPGPILARVDAPDGGELRGPHRLRRYKVRYPFAPAGGSPWVPRIQPQIGPDHGMDFPLPEGTEVLVAFRGGDPDQPFITGALPDAARTFAAPEDPRDRTRILARDGQVVDLRDGPEAGITLGTRGAALDLDSLGWTLATGGTAVQVAGTALDYAQGSRLDLDGGTTLELTGLPRTTLGASYRFDLHVAPSTFLSMGDQWRVGSERLVGDRSVHVARSHRIWTEHLDWAKARVQTRAIGLLTTAALLLALAEGPLAATGKVPGATSVILACLALGQALLERRAQAASASTPCAALALEGATGVILLGAAGPHKVAKDVDPWAGPHFHQHLRLAQGRASLGVREHPGLRLRSGAGAATLGLTAFIEDTLGAGLFMADGNPDQAMIFDTLAGPLGPRAMAECQANEDRIRPWQEFQWRNPDEADALRQGDDLPQGGAPLPGPNRAPTLRQLAAKAAEGAFRPRPTFLPPLLPHPVPSSIHLWAGGAVHFALEPGGIHGRLRDRQLEGYDLDLDQGIRLEHRHWRMNDQMKYPHMVLSEAELRLGFAPSAEAGTPMTAGLRMDDLGMHLSPFTELRVGGLFQVDPREPDGMIFLMGAAVNHHPPGNPPAQDEAVPEQLLP